MKFRHAALSVLLAIGNANHAESFINPTGRRPCTCPCSIFQQQQKRNMELFETTGTHPKNKKQNQKKRKRPRNSNTSNVAKDKNNATPPSRSRSIARGRDPILSLNMNLDFLGKSGQVNAAERAEELLMRIEALHDDGYYDARPDAVSYNAVMNAYAISASKDGASNAKRLLGRMETLSSSEKGACAATSVAEPNSAAVTNNGMEGISKGDTKPSNRSLKPNVVSFNTVIRAYAKSPSTSGAKEAEEILLQMERMVKNKDPKAVRPNAITYNSVIDAWAKRSRRIKNAAERAEWWLHRMVEVNKSQLSEGIDEEDLVKPDSTSFNTVLHAWAKSKNRNKAQNAERLLHHMEKLYYKEGNVDMKPDVVSYTSLIDAYAASYKNRKIDAASKASQVLSKMENLYEETGDESIRPNRISYATVINAYSKRGGIASAKKAQNILEKMETLRETAKGENKDDLGPDVVCYTSVIDAWARSDSEKAGVRAEELLRRAETRFEETGDYRVKPNARTYCSVISALGRSRAYGSAEHAEEFLRQMEQKYEECHEESIKPTTIVYNAVIDAYARSSFVEKAERAQALLIKMREQSDVEGREYLRPDVITYNSVLNACANAFGDDETKGRAYRIGLRAFRELHKISGETKRRNSYPGLGPTSVSYALLLKALRKLVEPGDERDDMIRRVFELCIKGGLVNGGVLYQVKSALSDREDKFGELLLQCGYIPKQSDGGTIDFDCDHVNVGDLPSEWTRNAGR